MDKTEEMEKAINHLFNSGESLYSISEKSGVPYATLHDLSRNKSYDMTRFKTIKSLYRYAKEKENK